MTTFTYHQTSKIIFGAGRIAELGSIASGYGKRVLLVTTPATVPALQKQYDRVKSILTADGLEVFHFDGVTANPTVETITAGAALAKAGAVEVIVGLGGGSSMDAAKAISVEATHGQSCWEYLFYKTPQPDASKLLPVIAVTTTSGTGSQVTQVAVVTNPETRDKSALYNNILYPQVALIDPELMLSVPQFVTATTGFDVFCHAFESIINLSHDPLVDLLAWEAVGIVLQHLPALVNDLGNIALREQLAYADLLGGLSIANVGVTLPHGMGMAIGGMYPKVAHGEALAIVYPSFVKFTQESRPDAFARVARLLNPSLEKASDAVASERCEEEIRRFLTGIGLNKKLSDCGMPESEIEALAKQCMVLPDYKANPRLATEEEMLELVRESWR
jgi:alcohol dehydrogenase class IV